MKQETKELLEEAISIIHQQERVYSIDLPEGEQIRLKNINETYRKIQAFLRSIPDIEKKLQHGGYIFDRNNTLCCQGDKVRFYFEEKGYEDNWKRKNLPRLAEGFIDFNHKSKSFQILFNKTEQGWDWIDWTCDDYGCEWFEKIEEKKKE